MLSPWAAGLGLMAAGVLLQNGLLFIAGLVVFILVDD